MNALTAGTGLLVILCCAVGPAVIGAAVGSAVGGWLAIACGALLATIVGVVFYRRRGKAC